MKRLLVELENLPEAGKKYSGELDSEIFGIDDEEVTSIGPLAFDLHVQRFENELFVRGNISAPLNSAVCVAWATLTTWWKFVISRLLSRLIHRMLWMFQIP